MVSRLSHLDEERLQKSSCASASSLARSKGYSRVGYVVDVISSFSSSGNTPSVEVLKSLRSSVPSSKNRSDLIAR